jgi:dTMP kinase
VLSQTNGHKYMLITLEGIDGSGKSSVAAFLAEALKNQNISVMLTREFGGSPLGKYLRTILHDRPFELCDKAEFLLIAADRAQHIAQIVSPALAANTVVISDRMADSSLAYQGFGRGLDSETIRSINRWAMNGLEPDLTLYFRLDYATAYSRLEARNKQLTAFEKEKKLFFDRVITGYETIFAGRDKLAVIDAALPLHEVQQRAVQIVVDALAAHTAQKVSEF